MKKIIVLLIVVSLFVISYTGLSYAGKVGGARIKLVVVSAGLSVFVEKWGPDFIVQPNSNKIFDNATGNPYGFKIVNTGIPCTISMGITNTDGANLITTGAPGDPVTGTSDIRIAAVFCEWDTSLTVSQFGSEDVLSATLKAANTGTGALHYPGFIWASGVNVPSSQTRPVAFSIDTGTITLGTEYNVDIKVDVN